MNKNENLNIPLDLKNVFNLKDYKLKKIKSKNSIRFDSPAGWDHSIR